RTEIDETFALRMDAIRARAAAAKDTMVRTFGGDDSYATVMEWAKGYYADRPTLREDINRRLAHADADIRESAARQILDDFKRNSGTDGSKHLATGGAAPATPGGPFTSVAELDAAE